MCFVRVPPTVAGVTVPLTCLSQSVSGYSLDPGAQSRRACGLDRNSFFLPPSPFPLCVLEAIIPKESPKH